RPVPQLAEVVAPTNGRVESGARTRRTQDAYRVAGTQVGFAVAVHVTQVHGGVELRDVPTGVVAELRRPQLRRAEQAVGVHDPAPHAGRAPAADIGLAVTVHVAVARDVHELLRARGKRGHRRVAVVVRHEIRRVGIHHRAGTAIHRVDLT